MPNYYLVCYDVADQKRLRKVYKVVKDFGLRAQWSVYLCRLHPREKAELQAKLLDVLHQSLDQVLFVNLGPAHQNERPPRLSTLGRELECVPPGVMIV